MRGLAVGLSIGVFAASLAAPALILAQEPEPVPPAPSEPVAPDPAPQPPDPASPPETVPPPTEPAPTPSPAAEPAPAEAFVAKGSVTVSMGDFFFDPATVTVNVGDTITWVNNGEEDHDAAGSGFSTGTIPPGGSGSATLSSAGTIPYICNFHPDDMTGTVIVKDTGGTDGGTETGVDPETGAPLGTEAAAGAAPGAAGTADALPASGEAEGPLTILGVGLLGCGLLATALARWRLRETALFPPVSG